MPANDYWPSLQKDYVDEMVSIIDEAKAQAFESFFQLVEGSDVTDRGLFYQGVDWDTVQQMAPDLYPRMSADALSIQEAERQKQIKALQDYEHQMYVQAAAFKPQLAPYGFNMGSPSSQSMGLETPISMGRFGA